MEDKKRSLLVVVAAVVAGGCICAVVAVQRYCSICRTSYFTLASAAPSPR